MVSQKKRIRDLIEAARTMLADSLLPIQFWAEAVNTACYVLNRVLVTKPQMKTPYEILMGRSPNISFMRPFGCPLTILNTLDQLGKFDGKSEEGYLLGYSTNSKGKGPDWMFDLELLTPSMNYIPVRKENYAVSGGNVSTYDDVEDLDDQQFIVHGPSIAAVQDKHSEEYTADKEVPLSSEEQALHDELVSLMHQESIAKVHNDAQRNAFEKEKRRIALEKGKECVDSTFTLSTANTPSQSTDSGEGGAQAKQELTSKSKQYMLGLLFSFLKRNQESLSSLADDSWIEFEANQTLLAFGILSWALLLSEWMSKGIFIWQTITEGGVYVNTASRFLKICSSNKSLRVVKALYGLHQAPRSLVYVDDIIFGSTKSSMVKDFEDLMQKEFKMSSMGELTFFLGLQVKQNHMLFQVTPKVSHIHAVKRIFRYLKHQPKLGLWYPKDSPFHLEAFSDSDYAGDNHDRRSTSGGCQYLGKKTGLLSNASETNNCGYIIYRGRICSSCKLLCVGTLDCQNQLLD
ncbi:putative ribonuclease H-like domain-containing protein [Tanacetum coccineum]|uniref:Ribonuclease H-like domain-containing protein n=1 Tax=Tanacetum coccineum TaxID=301880 RepID=A0ABQ5DHG6_9ASTR